MHYVLDSGHKTKPNAGETRGAGTGNKSVWENETHPILCTIGPLVVKVEGSALGFNWMRPGTATGSWHFIKSWQSDQYSQWSPWMKAGDASLTNNKGEECGLERAGRLKSISEKSGTRRSVCYQFRHVLPSLVLSRELNVMTLRHPNHCLLTISLINIFSPLDEGNVFSTDNVPISEGWVVTKWFKKHDNSIKHLPRPSQWPRFEQIHAWGCLRGARERSRRLRRH